MMTFNYTINGKKVELGVNNDGSGLFQRGKDGNWNQLVGTVVTVVATPSNSTAARRAIYNYYRRHFSI